MERSCDGVPRFALLLACSPKTLELLDDTLVEDDAATTPRWVEIQSLKPEDFQAHGEIILELCRNLTA